MTPYCKVLRNLKWAELELIMFRCSTQGPPISSAASTERKSLSSLLIQKNRFFPRLRFKAKMHQTVMDTHVDGDFGPSRASWSGTKMDTK